MVMDLPSMVATSLAAGLSGGPGGGPWCGADWASIVVAANRRLVQMRRRFMFFFLQAEPSFKGNGLDAMIVALRGMAREAELFPICVVNAINLTV
jgi:hypothetical protein